MKTSNFLKHLQKHLARNPRHAQLPLLIGNRSDLKKWEIIPIHVSAYEPTLCFLEVSNINPANALWVNYALPKSKEELV